MAGTLTPGSMFAGYRIERLLGRGGMGAVYAAQHPRLPRRDALKVLAADADSSFRGRFLRESDLAARLDHPNIVVVHDRGVHHGTPWIAMRLVDGTDAAATIRANPAGLAVRQALHIVTEAARGLDAAHRAGLLHRDIKPANIMLESRPGEPDRILVTDFGIARATDETALTETGAVLGTLAYAAPEQLSADTMDHRTDVYALGCTFFELLTGTKPFPYPTAGEVLRGHLMDPPPQPTARRTDLPPAVDTVIATALAKDPGRRYPSCGALAAAAAAAFGAETVRTDPTPPLEHWTPPVSRDRQPPAHRRKWELIAAALLTTVAVLVVAGIVLFRDGGTSEPSAGTVTSAPPSTTTPPAAAAPWGNYSFVVDTFPDLFPTTPESTGYQGIRCTAVDPAGRRVDVNDPAPEVTHLNCNGNRDPLLLVVALCSSAREPLTDYATGSSNVFVGEADWKRGNRSGHIIWSDAKYGADPAGFLSIRFDDPDRNFCTLTVGGGTSGRELHDTWWPTAPV